MCFVWISEQPAIISLYSMDYLVFIIERERVYCAVRTEALCIVRLIFLRIVCGFVLWQMAGTILKMRSFCRFLRSCVSKRYCDVICASWCINETILNIKWSKKSMPSNWVTNQVTNFMQQSPSLEVSQEIPRIFRNLKVHYRIHKSPPPLYVLSQSNRIHASPSHFC